MFPQIETLVSRVAALENIKHNDCVTNAPLLATAAMSDPAEHKSLNSPPVCLRSNAVASLIAIINHDIV